VTKSNTTTQLNYKQTTNEALKLLRRDRDRQIIAKRFGFGLAKRQTLEKIGQDFGITRERVRQIEKAALGKLKHLENPELEAAGTILSQFVTEKGGLALLSDVAVELGATTPGDQAYIVFLAELASGLEVIDENDQLRLGLGILPEYSVKTVRALSQELIKAVAAVGKPAKITKIAAGMTSDISTDALEELASLTKGLAYLDGNWGLISWPEVNPKSIRDKTYLVLRKHGEPLHFGDIAVHIHNTGLNKRQVTVQAVHNELIKDDRFVLIGRGIYALADWGYTPGTVADIIVDVLRDESPLHKDEIVRRVLEKRQVKTTTIVLNLQEKEQFVRVAKATYRLAP
jgi:hypothetical protein